MTTSNPHIAQKSLPSGKIGIFPILLLVLFILFLVDLALGSVRIPVGDVFKSLIGEEVKNGSWEKIVTLIRLPKAITALLAGSALSVSGLQMQTLFKNPLAGPSVLGITAGASIGVALVMLTSGGATSVYLIRELGIGSSWLIIVAATAGAALVMTIILGLSIKIRDNVALLIVGIMVGNLAIALISIWQYFSRPEQIQDYLIWTFGSLSGVTNRQLFILLPIIGIGLTSSFMLSKILNTLLLGENYARSLGLNIMNARFGIILLTSLLAGAVTGFCGPIAFVGIAVPHLCRAIFDSSDHRILIPAVILGGSIIMVGCDIIAQIPGNIMTLPINAITTLIGSPIVVWVVIKKNNLRRSF